MSVMTQADTGKGLSRASESEVYCRIEGLYEYCGKQRSGKSTLMVRDCVKKLVAVGPWKMSDVYCNFTVFHPEVHCLENKALLRTIMEFKAKDVRDKIIMLDEAGQELKARGYMDKEQTEVVSFCWQMPKMNIVLLWCSNPGNSGDVILRDATGHTVMPQYHEGRTRAEDYITAHIIDNYGCTIQSGIYIPDIHEYQEMFDTLEPVR